MPEIIIVCEVSGIEFTAENRRRKIHPAIGDWSRTLAKSHHNTDFALSVARKIGGYTTAKEFKALVLVILGGMSNDDYSLPETIKMDKAVAAVNAHRAAQGATEVSHAVTVTTTDSGWTPDGDGDSVTITGGGDVLAPAAPAAAETPNLTKTVTHEDGDRIRITLTYREESNDYIVEAGDIDDTVVTTYQQAVIEFNDMVSYYSAELEEEELWITPGKITDLYGLGQSTVRTYIARNRAELESSDSIAYPDKRSVVMRPTVAAAIWGK